MAGRSKKQPFFTPMKKLKGEDIAIEAGRTVAQSGGFIGMNYVANLDQVAAGKIRKFMGPIAFGLGFLGNIFINKENPAGKIVGGLADGFTTWGVIDTIYQQAPGAASKLGINGLAGVGNATAAPIDWGALAAEMRAQENGEDIPEYTMEEIQAGADSDPYGDRIAS